VPADYLNNGREELLQDESPNVDLVEPTLPALKSILAPPSRSVPGYEQLLHGFFSGCILSIDEMRCACCRNHGSDAEKCQWARGSIVCQEDQEQHAGSSPGSDSFSRQSPPLSKCGRALLPHLNIKTSREHRGESVMRKTTQLAHL
jgi:hypothetical protein